MKEQHTVLCPKCNRVDCTYTKLGTTQCILHCKSCGDIYGIKEESEFQKALKENRILNVLKSIGNHK